MMMNVLLFTVVWLLFKIASTLAFGLSVKFLKKCRLFYYAVSIVKSHVFANSAQTSTEEG